ncbi:MAG: GtrA family protein [Synechococcus sp.]
MNQLLSGQLLRFVLANSFAAVINIVTRFLGSLVIVDAWAVVAGFCAGLSTSYLLCRGFVFRTVHRASLWEVLRFTGINLLALALTGLVYSLSLQWLVAAGIGPATNQMLRTSAHAFGVAAPVLFSFVAQKTFTFRHGR